MRTIAAIYARVSTHHQEEEETIASQIAALESYAKKEGYKLKEELYYLDEGISGAKLDRPGLDRLRDQASEGKYDTVICLSPDRLARQYLLQEILLEEFKHEGIEVKFVNQPAVRDDPQSQLFYGIQGLFAEYERAIIGERMRRGRLHRARQGQMVQPSTPYGYRYVAKEGSKGGRWEIETSEAHIVQQIYDWYISGEEGDIRKIVKRLSETEAAPRESRGWYVSLVNRILKRRQYTGIAYYNRTENVYNEVGELRKIGHGKRKYPISQPRLEEEWIKIEVPAIIDQETWQIAQERMKANQKNAIRNNRQHFYLLRGLLICGVCGHTLSARKWGNQKTTYSCYYGGEHRSPDIPRHSCNIAAEDIEPLVWDAIRELLQEPQLISQAWDGISNTQAVSTGSGEKGRLENRLKSLMRQQERLLDLYQEEQIDKDKYLVRKERLQQEQQKIEEQMLRLDQQERVSESKQRIIENFEQFCQHTQANLANPTPETQREVIRLLVDHIVIEENEIVIKHIIPSTDDCRLSPSRRGAEARRKNRS